MPSKEFTVNSSQLTAPGRDQDHRQNNVGYYEPAELDKVAASGRLYLVADGIGDPAAGEVASNYVVNKVLQDFENSRELDLDRRLIAAIEAANTAIFTHNEQHPELGHMAATLVAAMIRGDSLLVARVGHSPAYLVRHQQIEQITQASSTSSDEIKHYPGRNLPSPRLGQDQQIAIDTFTRQLMPDDVLILCTAGLIHHVDELNVAQIVTKNDPRQAARQLVDLAKTDGVKDGLAISITRILTEERVTTTAISRPDKISRPGSAEIGSDTSRRLMPVGIALVFLFVLAGIILFLFYRNRTTEIAVTLPLPTSTSAETAIATPETVAQQRSSTATTTPTQTLEPSPTSPPTPTATAPATNPPSSPTSALNLAQAGDQILETAPTEAAPVKPLPPPSESLADCTSLARYLNEDLYTADGTALRSGQTFAKGWLIENTGTCAWDSGYTLRPLRPGPLGEEPVFLTQLLPQATMPVSVTMTAPEEEGTYISCWQLHTPTGQPFGPRLFGEVVIDNPTAENPAQARPYFNVVEEAVTAPWAAEFQVSTLLKSDILSVTIESVSPPVEPPLLEITFNRTDGPSELWDETAIVSGPVNLPFNQTFPLTAVQNCVSGLFAVQITPSVTSTTLEPLSFEMGLLGR